MKNLSATILLICLSIFAELPAQTIKNIYRHNLPVLRIPTALIDKVETADIDGQRTLRVIQFNGFVSQIPVALIDSITHTDGTALDPAQLGNLRTASVMGVVRGPTGALVMNAIVRSLYGGEETHTDANGVFFLNNILVYDKLGYITITKPGFHQGSRSFLPLETGSNRVNVQLLTMTQSGTFIATAGGTVTSGSLQLTFPANSIQLNGQPYTGTVNVYAQALDPTAPEMFDQMPGELLGGMNDSLRLLRSFGMASIELRDASMNELQLANGQSATLKFNIPTTLQADAPATIDWWSFDETLGYWKHEGVAQRQGNKYVGLASHFSWWNWDIPQYYNNFQGVVNTSSGSPISDAQIKIISQTLGSGTIYTNSDGTFTCRVPQDQSLTLNVNLTCNSTNDWVLAHSETITSEQDSIVGSYTAEISNYYPISGTVVNCSGQPVAIGYVKIGSQIFITENGEFTIQTCSTGNYQIQGFDTSIPDSVKVSTLNSVFVDNDGIEIGNIEACSEIYGIVADIDGNIYTTVIIGSQKWMAENLKTETFSEGSQIQNVTINSGWTQITTPAWSNYSNNTINDTLYGKLYNWFAVADPRNVCPTNWHVPTDEEWNTLIGFIHPAYNPSNSGVQSNIAGGKMKSITGWGSENFGANNETGFSGLPGGTRSHQNGLFYGVGSEGYWWSSTESSVTTKAWFRSLFISTPASSRSSNYKNSGYSVRCIMD